MYSGPPLFKIHHRDGLIIPFATVILFFPPWFYTFHTLPCTQGPFTTQQYPQQPAKGIRELSRSEKRKFLYSIHHSLLPTLFSLFTEAEQAKCCFLKGLALQAASTPPEAGWRTCCVLADWCTNKVIVTGAIYRPATS